MLSAARRALSLLVLLPLALVLPACSSSEDAPEYVERPAEEIYAEAAETIEGGEFNRAAQLFDEVERQHPYSQWAVRAQLMAAYSHYQAEKYEDAIVALDRFIQLHPGNADAPYAYYLRALCYYEQISDVKRDQKMTQMALSSLEEVVTRFPDTDYARDAKLKLDLARDHLAGKEMEIGRFYLRQNQYQAAIKRFQAVIADYQTTSHVPEALHRLTECYLALGLTDEARATAAVLGYNYPGSEWYQDSYGSLVDGAQPSAGGSSWIGGVWKSVF